MLNESHVEFTPDGLFLMCFAGKPRNNKLVRRRIKRRDVLVHLRRRCEIAEGTTLLHIFDAVDKYPRLKAFIAQYSWCGMIDEFHAQAHEPMREDDDDEKIDFLEIYHHHSAFQYKKEPIDLELSYGFHGIGKSKDGMHCLPDGTVRYSVSCTPMWKICDIPVKLNKEVIIWKPWNKKDGEKELMKGVTSFTLLEVLDSIYDDISFYGGPEQSQQFLEEMKERVDEIDRGEAKLVSLDELKEKLGIVDDEVEEVDDKIQLHPEVLEKFDLDIKENEDGRSE